MSKGESTREAILDQALRRVSVVGLSGVSIGELASALNLSKSGLFAHFGSKERLAVEMLERASEHFIAHVLSPAIREPRGEPRVRALFERWLSWSQAQEGGCIFLQLGAEFDDQPGVVRDALVKAQRDWQSALAEAARISIREGHFRADLDPEQFGFEMYSLMIGCHHFQRLLGDPESVARLRRAFDGLLERSRAKA
jgi:AcrR family transcriptional regulator